MDKLLKDLAEVVRQRNAAEYAAVALSADDFYAENKEFRSKAVRFIATHHAKIAEALADAVKWRRHVAELGKEHSHFCRSCGYYYTPTASESEDCPACGFDGIDAQHNSTREGE